MLDRREFVKVAGIGAAIAASKLPAFGELGPALRTAGKTTIPARADAMVMIYLPGGVAQQDTWDPKEFTPYRRGMRGSELLSTCKSISTAARAIQLGEGMEQIAQVMDKGAIIRSLKTKARFGASHVKAQFYSMTRYLEPVGLKPPSLGSIIARTLGPRDPQTPSYFYIGRDINVGGNVDRQKAVEFTGPGFYGNEFAPFRVADPSVGLRTLNALAGMSRERIDRRLQYLKSLTSAAAAENDATIQHYLNTLEDARRMMDSPAKKAFEFMTDESPELIKAYQPRIARADLQDKNYYEGTRFGHGLLLARRLVERGARYIQVELMYDAFKGFDMHDNGAGRMVEMKKQIDGPIARFIRDLSDRGLLERTLVCIESEFGRTIASAPAQNHGGLAGAEPIGASEEHDGKDLIIDREFMYGFHGHFSTNHSVALFGGAIKSGALYGRTADLHPMLPIENPVELTDIHATIFKALGIPADHNYVTEGRPFYVTKDGLGKAIDAVLS